MKPEGKPLTMMLLDISKMMQDRMRIRTQALGVQHGFNRIIFELAHNGKKTQNELAEATKLSSPTVSVTLQAMERAGLVCRVQDENDLRKINVALTDKGKQADRVIGNTIRENECLFMKGLSEEEIAALKGILIKIYNNFADGEK